MSQDTTISLSTTYTLDAPSGVFGGLVQAYERTYEKVWFASARVMERTERMRQSLMAFTAAASILFVVVGYGALNQLPTQQAPSAGPSQMMALNDSGSSVTI